MDTWKAVNSSWKCLTKSTLYVNLKRQGRHHHRRCESKLGKFSACRSKELARCARSVEWAWLAWISTITLRRPTMDGRRMVQLSGACFCWTMHAPGAETNTVRMLSLSRGRDLHGGDCDEITKSLITLSCCWRSASVRSLRDILVGWWKKLDGGKIRSCVQDRTTRRKLRKIL